MALVVSISVVRVCVREINLFAIKSKLIFCSFIKRIDEDFIANWIQSQMVFSFRVNRAVPSNYFYPPPNPNLSPLSLINNKLVWTLINITLSHFISFFIFIMFHFFTSLNIQYQICFAHILKFKETFSEF